MQTPPGASASRRWSRTGTGGRAKPGSHSAWGALLRTPQHLPCPGQAARLPQIPPSPSCPQPWRAQRAQGAGGGIWPCCGTSCTWGRGGGRSPWWRAAQPGSTAPCEGVSPTGASTARNCKVPLGSRTGCCWPCSRLALAWPWARAQPSVPAAGPSTRPLSPPNFLKPTVRAAQQMKRYRGHERGLGVLCIMGSFSCSPAECVCRWWCEKMMPLCLFLLHQAGHALSNSKHQGQLFLPVGIIRVSNVLVCCLECASLNRNTSK